MKMKRVLKLLGIIAVIAVIGFSVIGCDSDGGCGGCRLTFVETAPGSGVFTYDEMRICHDMDDCALRDGTLRAASVISGDTIRCNC